MKKLKQDKVKRWRIILSAVLTFCICLLSLGFGAYLGYVTLNINYITIGTLTPMVGGLLVVAGFFIFFGCIGGVISLKEIFISSRNEQKFTAYKGSLISAIIYYVIIAIISIVGFIVTLASYVPSYYCYTIIGLSVLALLLCAGSFYLVLKELKEHKKNGKSMKNEIPLANMQLKANEIRNLKNVTLANGEHSEILSNMEAGKYDCVYGMQDNNYRNEVNGYQNEGNRSYSREDVLKGRYSSYEDAASILEKTKQSKDKEDIDFVILAEKLMQLEELRKAGLINDQEYQSLKQKFI